MHSSMQSIQNAQKKKMSFEIRNTLLQTIGLEMYQENVRFGGYIQKQCDESAVQCLFWCWQYRWCLYAKLKLIS